MPVHVELYDIAKDPYQTENLLNETVFQTEKYPGWLAATLHAEPSQIFRKSSDGEGGMGHTDALWSAEFSPNHDKILTDRKSVV